ncbi:PTS sugar transporter subunit IIA [Salinisphaera hydrothermalis]|nr:PTS fructose transporter subunit IIA [Salinisphaera hydrothermalis]
MPSATPEPMPGLILVGHAGLPEALLAAARHVIGALVRPTRIISVSAKDDPEGVERDVAAAIDALDSGAGVLILIDVMGATPYRIAHAAAQNRDRVALVTGANLAMLIRSYNYPGMSLAELAESAVAAGQRSVARVH